MSVSRKLMVFDALMLRGLVANDDELFGEGLAAFRVAFRGRTFRLLLTDGIQTQYQIESMRVPQFLPQPTLQRLLQQDRAIYLEERYLSRVPVQFAGLPQEHQEFILDALAGRASYLVTNRPAWLNLSEQTNDYGLQIVSPARFVVLEG